MILQLCGPFRTSKWLCDAFRLLTEKASQKRPLRNRETAWPGELKDTVFGPALGWSSVSKVASRILKKEMILQLWGPFRTSEWLWHARQTLRLEPYKKTWFCSFGAHFSHLQIERALQLGASLCASTWLLCSWMLFLANRLWARSPW